MCMIKKIAKNEWSASTLCSVARSESKFYSFIENFNCLKNIVFEIESRAAHDSAGGGGVGKSISGGVQN